MIALEITWVVDTGMPKWAVVNRIVAAVVSAGIRGPARGRRRGGPSSA